MFGLLRALNAMARGAKFGGNELKNACRAGALCMVVRAPDWRPILGEQLDAVLFEQKETNEDLENKRTPTAARMVTYFPSYAREDSSAWAYFDTIGSRAYVDPDLTRIHGTYHLEPGYTFAIIPRNAQVEYIKRPESDHERAVPNSEAPQESSPAAVIKGQPSLRESQSTQDVLTAITDGIPPVDANRATSSDARSSSERKDSPSASPNEATDEKPLRNDISSNYSIVKAVASLIQLLAGLETLISHREDVIERWGYAAFHLTVIPYMLMTVVNLISNLLVADYPCLYMVESETMKEAKARGCKFNGVVGSLQGYQLENATEVPETEVIRWKGISQRHLANFAKFLNGDLIEIDIFLRRASRRNMTSVSTRFNPIDITQTGTMSLVQYSVDATAQNPRAAVLEGSTQEKIVQSKHTQEGVSPECSHYNGDGVSHASVHEKSIQHDENEASSTFVDQEIRAVASVPEAFEGRRFHIKQHVTPKLIDLPKWKSRLKFSKNKAEPSVGRPRKLDFSELMQSYVDIFVFTLGTISPVYARLIDAIEEARNTRTGKETWTEHLRLLFQSVYFPNRDPKKRNKRKPKIYVPNCSPFVREGEDPKAPPKSRGNVGVMMLLQVLLGCVILATLITFVGWQSHWFSRGNSSRTERAIVMLWMSEGAFGLLLPLISLKEIVMIFFLLPLYATISYASSALPYSGLVMFERISVLAFVPIGIFIAPVWAFVLIGRMLVEWGRCVTLY